MSHRACAVAALASLAVATAGMLGGVRVAGGADSYGYVSQAHLWATGTLTVAQPLSAELGDLVPRGAFAPLGYIPGPRVSTIVPVYAPGLPMLMGVAERLAGPRAVFVVVPLLGALGVWATWLLGRRLAGPFVGAAAAILLAVNPAFLSQLMFPESDVPVTAWWTLCLALVAGGGQGAAAGAGLAAAAAILTRPNLVPLAAVPGAWLVWRAARDRTGVAARRALLFALAAIPACLIVAALNTTWYGSPLASGYGTLQELFSWAHLGPNLERYPLWLLRTLTPIVLLAPAAPLLMPRAIAGQPPIADSRGLALMCGAFAITAFGCYVFYLPWEDPGFVRFLLPAFPPLAVLTSISLMALSARLPRALRPAVPIAVVGLIAWRDAGQAFEQNVVHRHVETRYAVVGDYLARRLPARAVVLSVQHSGSARYYSGRTTIRYDVIPPAKLDAVLERLTQLGREPYVLLDEGEESAFRERFGAHSPLGLLDWPPVAQLRSPRVNLYDTSEAHVSGRQALATDLMD